MLQKSLLPFSILLALSAHAEDAQVQPTIEVTASRVAETADSSLADVSVITRTDIDRSGTQDLIDLLRLQAGVDVARTGGVGEQTSVFLRGTNSNHVLVLIDGVRVASSNTGSFAFENLPLDAVERIEIVRGPRASYWGSDAIGGVIQIFTRRLDGPRVAASYGTYNDADGSVGFGQHSDAGGFSVQVGARHVGGFSTTNPAVCNGPNDPYCIFNPDDNGMQNHNIVAQGDVRLGTQTLSASGLRIVGTENFDNGATDGIWHTLDQSIGADLAGPITPTWSHRLSIASSREDIDIPAFANALHSTRDQVSWANDITLDPSQHLIAGVDYVHDHGVSIDTSGGFGAPYQVNRDNAGAFGGWRVDNGAFDSELSGRYDHYDNFGSAFSGSGAFGWKFTDTLRLSASYGTAFRAPNLNELYSPGYGGLYAGNPDLDPERSRTAEVALDWHADAANRFQVRGFSTRIHDLIDFSGGTTNYAINVEHAAIDGFELMHTWAANGWSVDSNATWQNPRNQDSDSQLLRRPKQKFDTLVQRTFGERVHAGVELFASGKREDLSTTLPGYALVNLRASYDIAATLSVSLRLENLFDRDYELARGYNTPGRAGYVQLAWQPRL
jgi:vitamin B12 transporter